jgi:hypothetical protein
MSHHQANRSDITLAKAKHDVRRAWREDLRARATGLREEIDANAALTRCGARPVRSQDQMLAAIARFLDDVGEELGR